MIYFVGMTIGTFLLYSLQTSTCCPALNNSISTGWAKERPFLLSSNRTTLHEWGKSEKELWHGHKLRMCWREQNKSTHHPLSHRLVAVFMIRKASSRDMMPIHPARLKTKHKNPVQVFSSCNLVQTDTPVAKLTTSHIYCRQYWKLVVQVAILLGLQVHTWALPVFPLISGLQTNFCCFSINNALALSGLFTFNFCL